MASPNTSYSCSLVLRGVGQSGSGLAAGCRCQESVTRLMALAALMQWVQPDLPGGEAGAKSCTFREESPENASKVVK